jgi:hypothetical protein
MKWTSILGGVLEHALEDSLIARQGETPSRLFPGTQRPMRSDELLNRKRRITDELCTDYFKVSQDEWGGGVCQEGYRVMKSFVETKLLDLVDLGPALDVLGMSACGVDDFRVRLICKHLYCESTVVSMPQLTHELARAFLMDNAKWLFEYRCENRSSIVSAEFKFRLRALKLDSMANVTWVREDFRGGNSNYNVFPRVDEQGDTSFFYVGFGDTPFDEEAYGLVRTVGMPGVRSLGGVMFVPIIGDGHQWLGGSCSVNGGGVELDQWSRYLVNAPRTFADVEEPLVLKDVSVSDSYAKKRRWCVAKQVVGDACDCTVGFRVVGLRDGVRYTEKRNRQAWLQITSDEYKEAEIYQWYPSGVLKNVDPDELLPDHEVRTETGERKALNDCEEGEWVFHCGDHRAGTRPSARVFDGGLYCKVCDKTFLIPAGCPWEEAYPFLVDEMTVSADPREYMPDVDWGVMLSKKYIVIEAPMGSGKTHQLQRLLDYLDENYGVAKKTVLVVSFRRVLSIQQAQRFGIHCYLDLSRSQILEDPKVLTLCLNSLTLLSKDPKYDMLILDECGLIRRHFMSRTMASSVRQCYVALKKIQKNAQNVIMLQEGISLEDVRFYTEAEDIAPDDRGHVNASCFLKPIEIHPIRWTSDLPSAYGVLVKEFKESFEASGVDGLTQVCKHPFMVFCSNASVCETIVVMLKNAAVHVGADPLRVKGLWAAVKDECDFCKRFTVEPNRWASEADVVVCTSTVGAGFSVETHFSRFFAFLFTNILDFGEERQFIQRLRFQMSEVHPNALRQSYLYVQAGGGKPRDYDAVVALFTKARKALVDETQRRLVLPRDVEGIPGLERVQARVAVEHAATTAHHAKLWQKYGGDLDSKFEELEGDDDVSKHGKLMFAEARKSFGKTLAEHFGDEDELGQMEVSAGVELLLQARKATAAKSFESAFGRYEVVARFYVKQEFDSKKALSILSGKSFVNWNIGVNAVISWLVWNYSHLDPGVSQNFFTHIQNGVYSPTAFKNVAHFKVASVILPLVFGGTEREQPDFRHSMGLSPFYVGASVLVDAELLAMLQKLILLDDADDADTTNRKKDFQAHIKVLINKDTQGDVIRTFTKVDSCRMFLKNVLNRMGLSTPTKTKRKTVQVLDYTVKVQLLEVGEYKQNLLFALCSKNRKQLLSLFPVLLTGPHLDVHDREIFQEAIHEFVKCCEDNDIPHGINLETIGEDMRHHAVGPQRRAEIEMIEDNPGLCDDYEEEEGVEDEQPQFSAAAAHALLALSDAREREQRLERAASQNVDHHERTIGADDEDDDDDNDEESIGNILVDTEAAQE